MAENKTKPTVADPDAYIASIANESRRNDCVLLMAIMSRATKLPPVMWGTAIVGYGVHSYPLAGGKVGEICSVGFCSRKGDISIYGLTLGENAAPLLASLGTHKLGKGCLYIRRMSDIDTKVLERLVVHAFKAKLA